MRWDAIVVGAGVLGTFHAFQIARLGKKVVVFEKDPHPREATVRNFGQVVPSGFAPGKWHEYGRYSTGLYKEFQSRGDIGIHNNGSLYIASDLSEMAVLEELHRRFADEDYHSELYTKEQVLQYNERFNTDYVVGGLRFPQEVSAESHRMIRSLQQLLMESYEVSFHYNTTVVDVLSSDACTTVVLAGGERVQADQVFICNGRDFNVLYPELFAHAPIEISKLQMLATEPAPFTLKGNILTGMTIRRYESFKVCDSYALLDPENAQPELAKYGIHVLFKQNPDGSIIIGDSHVYADSASGFDPGFDEKACINELILNEANRILDMTGVKINRYWSGYYAQMKDGEDVYEQTIDGRIHITTAIGGKGMTASAGYAKDRIAQLFAVELT